MPVHASASVTFLRIPDDIHGCCKNHHKPLQDPVGTEQCGQVDLQTCRTRHLRVCQAQSRSSHELHKGTKGIEDELNLNNYFEIGLIAVTFNTTTRPAKIRATNKIGLCAYM